MTDFDYTSAFSRNIGWVTESEQNRLRQAKVAIAGMGGVGGIHALTLARLGIGRFHVSDFDVFDVVNFNRQAAAFMDSIGRPKVEVVSEMVHGINPEAEITSFPKGVNADNIADFLDGVDVYVDGLDFFAFSARKLTFAACEKRGIPVVTAAPLGMGAAVLVFAPGGMSYEEYFGFDDCDEIEMAIRFLVGLSPAVLQRTYVADPSRINLAERKGPSSITACQICAGMAGVEALKLLLKRPGTRLAPHGMQFDAYRMKLARTWRPFGAKNPLQALMRSLIRAQLKL